MQHKCLVTLNVKILDKYVFYMYYSAIAIHGAFGRKRDTYAAVWSTGHVYVVFGVHINTLCVLDLTYYPFDEQLCLIKIGNWLSVDQLVRTR